MNSNSESPAGDGGQKLSHLDEKGAPRMVDVSGKEVSQRTAVAEGVVIMQPSTLAAIRDGRVPKGNVYEVARLAGIMAAKNTPQIIPLCHPIRLSGVQVDLEPEGDDRVRIEARVKASDRTGVEMEALTAVGAAALTLYDMIKAIEKGARIEGLRLLEKDGGRSGRFRAK